MTNLRQTKEFARYMSLSGWIIEKTKDCYVFLRKILPLPPLIMKVQYPKPPIPFEKIEKLARKYRPFKIQIHPLKVEPGLEKFNYRPSKEASHVTKTLQIDLTQSEKEILAQMKKDARSAIKKALKTHRERVQTLSRCGGNTLRSFHHAWKKSVGWQRYVPSLKTLKNLKKAFGQNALFLVAAKRLKNTPGVCECTLPVWKKRKKIIAGTIVLIADQAAYYYFAFTSKQGRKIFSQYLLVWEAIKEAKKKDCRIFDFEGIYDQRFPVKSWQGFTHFKKSFGGKEVKYPGCWRKHGFSI